MALADNKAKIQTLLDEINALPEAGEGGGGASVDTCSVTIYNNVGYEIWDLIATVCNNGAISTVAYLNYHNDEPIPYGLTIENVVCGTDIFIYIPYMMTGYELSGGVALVKHKGEGGALLRAPTTAGASATITTYDDD